MRLVLASLVVLSHSWPLSGHGESREPFVLLTNGQATGGAIAVAAFFAISGLLIAMSWERCKGLGDFLRRRVLRIHPGFIVAFGISLILGILTTTDPTWRQAIGIKGTVLDAAMLHHKEVPGAFGNNPYPGAANGSLWTIQYEFWCYLFVALLGLSRLLRSKVAVLGLFALTLVFLTFYPKGLGNQDFWNYLPNPLHGEWPRLLACFLSGTVLYVWRESVPKNGCLFGASVLALALSCFGFFWTVAPIAMTYVIFYLCFSQSWFVGKCQKTDISYGVYLYAFPIQQGLAFFGISNPLLLFALAMPLTLCAGALSWFLVERPFLRQKSKRSSSASNGPSPPTTLPAGLCAATEPEDS